MFPKYTFMYKEIRKKLKILSSERLCHESRHLQAAGTVGVSREERDRGSVPQRWP